MIDFSPWYQVYYAFVIPVYLSICIAAGFVLIDVVIIAMAVLVYEDTYGFSGDQV